ncbi:hypothetical protein [Paraburkholderia sp. BR10882]|uniref:hypothetical protein n=1 Tax=unclassified Paraburkholderia TaxID=2615204 RepID=UPI0034CE6074
MSEAEFDESLKAGPAAYASKYLGGWSQYETQLASQLNVFSDELSGLGVKIIKNLDIEELRLIFLDKTVVVVVIFSHWAGRSVEMHGRLVDAEEIVRCVPQDFFGIFDICVCRPMFLIERLSRDRQNCTVRHIPVKADPEMWWLYFLCLFRLLASGNRNYLDATVEVSQAFINWRG